MTAREEILGRIRSALGPEASDPGLSYASIPRTYVQNGALDGEARLELFLDRLVDYDTILFQIEHERQISAAIMQALDGYDRHRVVAPIDFPAAWLPHEVQVTRDAHLGIEALATMQSVITTCELGVASTGTIFLVHGGAQGRRALTLLPDHHICVIRRDQIVETIPEAIARTAAMAAKPITTISGPSATSDIEMTRIRGVHGPRKLSVIVYGEL